jgi:hypothetical protein
MHRWTRFRCQWVCVLLFLAIAVSAIKACKPSGFRTTKRRLETRDIKKGDKDKTQKSDSAPKVGEDGGKGDGKNDGPGEDGLLHELIDIGFAEPGANGGKGGDNSDKGSSGADGPSVLSQQWDVSAYDGLSFINVPTDNPPAAGPTSSKASVLTVTRAPSAYVEPTPSPSITPLSTATSEPTSLPVILAAATQEPTYSPTLAPSDVPTSLEASSVNAAGSEGTPTEAATAGIPEESSEPAQNSVSASSSSTTSQTDTSSSSSTTSDKNVDSEFVKAFAGSEMEKNNNKASSLEACKTTQLIRTDNFYDTQFVFDALMDKETDPVFVGNYVKTYLLSYLVWNLICLEGENRRLQEVGLIKGVQIGNGKFLDSDCAKLVASEGEVCIQMQMTARIYYKQGVEISSESASETALFSLSQGFALNQVPVDEEEGFLGVQYIGSPRDVVDIGTDSAVAAIAQGEKEMPSSNDKGMSPVAVTFIAVAGVMLVVGSILLVKRRTHDEKSYLNHTHEDSVSGDNTPVSFDDKSVTPLEKPSQVQATSQDVADAEGAHGHQEPANRWCLSFSAFGLKQRVCNGFQSRSRALDTIGASDDSLESQEQAANVKDGIMVGEIILSESESSTGAEIYADEYIKALQYSLSSDPSSDELDQLAASTATTPSSLSSSYSHRILSTPEELREYHLSRYTDTVEL